MDNFTFKSMYGNYEGCYFSVNKYRDGNIRLDIISETEGPIVTVTSTTGQRVPDDHIVVKNYSENAGMLDWLMEEGIVDDISYFISSGFVELPVCHLTEKGLAIVEGN